MLFTGGASPFRPGQPPEGQRYLQEARQLGIPAAAMASTPPVLNTADEAVAIRRLLPARQSRVLLVTSGSGGLRLVMVGDMCSSSTRGAESPR